MRAIQTVHEMSDNMINELSESEKKRRIYKVESKEFAKAELATDITRAIATISDKDRQRVDFTNPDDVRQRIVDYFTACGTAGVYPSVQGLAVHGFGISRQALNQWRTRSRKDTFTTDNDTRREVEGLIDCACDMMADILTNQSLHNNANPVQALFQLKNNHSFADKVEIQQVYENTDDELSPEAMRARYKSMIDSLPEPIEDE